MIARLTSAILFGLSLSSTHYAAAHHAFAANNEMDNVGTVEGIVEEVFWANPHVHYYIQVTKEDGTWTAEPWSEHPDAGADPAPLDISGLWSSVSRGTHKDAFDLTPTGAAINEAYDTTLDDPHLRCVSGGVIRMEDAPFDNEIIDRGDHILATARIGGMIGSTDANPLMTRKN